MGRAEGRWGFRWPPVGAGCFGETTRRREPWRLLGTSVRHGEHRGGGEHICFYSKQSGADTAGSSGLLLKAFWGLLRDGVIYPLFAEWIGGGFECDVYGCGIPISHPKQGCLDQSRQRSATGWNWASLLVARAKGFTSWQAKLQVSVKKLSLWTDDSFKWWWWWWWQGKCSSSSCSKAEWKEVGTTASHGPCAPIFLNLATHTSGG